MMTTPTSNFILIKKVNNNIFDLFWDTGWENWTRIKISGEKVEFLIKKYVPPFVHSFIPFFFIKGNK